MVVSPYGVSMTWTIAIIIALIGPVYPAVALILAFFAAWIIGLWKMLTAHDQTKP
jgi:hypothetical protein